MYKGVVMIFDTHAHYEDKKFEEDREFLLKSLTEHGVCSVVNVGSDLRTSKASIELAKKYPNVYAAIGVHPSETGGLSRQGMEWLKEASKEQKVVAIGEIGLDYYWEKEKEVQEQQREWFIRQLALARECNMPVIIHSRDAAEDTMKILKEDHRCFPNKKNPGVVHCYSYSSEMAKEYVEMGYYIGVGGVLTFKNARKLTETVEKIPLEALVVETDCPYMAPTPHRGSRNQSSYLSYVVERIAQIKGIGIEEVEQVTKENAERLYGL